MERQYQTEAINELAAALAKAQTEIGHASKDMENEAFKRGNKISSYAGLPSVFDAARPFLAKNGLSVAQITDFDESGNVVLMTQLTHTTGQWMRSWYPVRPVKQDPQGLGSALTYARRYAYCSMVGVAAADDDDDGNAASGNFPPQKSGPVDTEKAAEIDNLLNSTKSDKAKFFDAFKIKDVRELRGSDYPRALAMLQHKAKQQKEADAAKVTP